jgi:hypothetical protein
LRRSDARSGLGSGAKLSRMRLLPTSSLTADARRSRAKPLAPPDEEPPASIAALSFENCGGSSMEYSSRGAYI